MAGIPSRVSPPNAYAAPTATQADGSPSHIVPLSVLTTLFFMWGGLTSLNDVLIPHRKGIFAHNYVQAMLFQYCLYGAYGLMSIPAGRFAKAIGLKKGFGVDLAGAAVGCLTFFPAAAV